MPRPTFICQVADRLHSDAHRAKRITTLVLHELRDRLPELNAAQIARHLPAALRPLWVDNDRHPATIEQPYKIEFLGDVMECGAFLDATEAERAVVAVFVVLRRCLDRATRNAGAVSAIFGQLPRDLAILWHAAEACGTEAPQRRRSRPVAARPRSHAASRSSAA
jgi:uncharacterized protein (DUF2267 family)